MSIDETLINPNVPKKEKAQLLRNDYSEWRLKKLANKSGFFSVYSEFADYLKELTPGAVTMYIFLGLKSTNMNGESFYDIPKMAEMLGKSPRTVSAYLKELEKANLIRRYQLQPNSVARTFLRPIPIKDNPEQQ